MLSIYMFELSFELHGVLLNLEKFLNIFLCRRTNHIYF